MRRRVFAWFSISILSALGAAAYGLDRASASSLWIAETGGAIRLSSSDGSIQAEIVGLGNVRAAGLDVRRETIWLLADRELSAFDLSGALRFSLPVPVPASVHAAASGPPPGRVEIQMVNSGDRELQGQRYVALVPEGRMWREPAFEALVAPGEPLPSWKVPAGRYRMICSEQNHWWDHGSQFDVAAGSVVRRRCELRALVSMAGEVVSAKGSSSIPNARVGHVHGFLEDFGLRLSPLGEQHARSQRTTTTDEHGRFVLVGPEDGRVALWFEADGFAPRWLTALLFPSGGGDLGQVRLDRGGRLHLLLADGHQAEREGYRITLIPAGAIPRTEREWVRLVEHVWAKSLSKTGPMELQWRSLPPGELEIWLVPADLGSVQIAPQRLDVVSIEAGRETAVSLRLPEIRPGDDTPGADGLASALRLRIRAGGPLGVFSVRRWADGWQSVSGLVRSEGDASLVVIPEGCQPGESYVVETATSISWPLDLSGADCKPGEPLELSLFPSGEVSGRFLAPQGASAPREARVVISACETQDRRSRPWGVFPVEIRENGSWVARLPVGCFLVEARFEEFGPESWQGVGVEEGEQNSLGARTLSAGATLLARAVSSADGRGIAGAEVTLVAEDDLTAEVQRSFSAVDLEESYQPSARTDARGWVAMSGLDPGTFRLKIQAEESLWPHFTGPIELHKNRETVLEYIEVPEPAWLEVELQQGENLLSEDDSVEVSVSGEATCGWIESVTMTREVSESSRVEFVELPAGTWSVTILSSDERGMRRPLGNARVELPPGEQKTLTVKLDRMTFHGIVTYEGEPVQGVLELIRSSGPDREQVRTTTNEAGFFSIPVRSPGEFTAKVVYPERKILAMIPGVVLEDPSTEAHIELPEGRLGGTVLNADGESLEGVHIRAEQVEEREPGLQSAEGSSESSVTFGVSEEGGRFGLEALAPGQWTLQAVSDGPKSRPMTIHLGEKEVRQGLVLTLEDGGVRGRLIDPAGGAVPRGVGWAEFLPAQGAIPEMLLFQWEEDGEFELEYPGLEDQLINVAVSAPGYPAFAVRRAGSELLDLMLPRETGTVDFSIGAENWPALILNQLALVGREGEYLLLSALKDRVEESEGVVTIYGLTTGSWHLVRTASVHDARVLALGEGRSLPALGAFDLRDGERVHVSVRPPGGEKGSPGEGGNER